MVSRAQGSIEYLVLIAIVVVISLVVTALATNIMGNDSVTLNSNSSKLSSKIGSGGINIIDSVTDSQGNGIVRLGNNFGETLTVTKVSVVDSAGNRTSTSFNNVTLASGGSLNFPVAALGNYCTCGTTDTVKTCIFEVTLTSASGLSKTQQASTSVNCVVTAKSNAPTPSPSLSTPFVWLGNYSASSVSKLNYSDGTLVLTYNLPVNSYTSGIAVDAGGNVWVASQGIMKLTELSSSGNLKGSFSSPEYLADVAVDANNNVWATGNNPSIHSIYKFSNSGALLNTYALPAGVSIYPLAIDGLGNVWVVNTNIVGSIFKVRISDGSISGPYTGFSQPSGIAIDADNNVWIASQANGLVYKASGSTGAIIQTFDFGMFSSPFNIAIDANNAAWIALAGTGINKVSRIRSGIVDLNVTVSSPVRSYADSNGNIWVVTANNVVKLSGVDGSVLATTALANTGNYGDSTGFAHQYFVLGRR